MPGSHDSGTWPITSNSVFIKDCASFPSFVSEVDFVGAISSWAKTQTADMGAQAANGVRYFDVRPAWVESQGQGSWVTCHSLAGASLEQAIGPNSALRKWAAAHPNESVIIDISHIYPNPDAGPGQPGSKLALAAWLETNVGPVTFPADRGKTLNDVTLADMRKAKRNIIVVGPSSLLTASSVWSREASLYTPWNGDSKAGIMFWDARYATAMFETVNQESSWLKDPEAAERLTVLNYIWNSACPTSGWTDDAGCAAAYAAPGSLLSWTKSYLVAGIPGFVAAVQYKARQAGVEGRPFVVMRDAVNDGSNAPIWEANR
jgi:hypothetical protein